MPSSIYSTMQEADSSENNGKKDFSVKGGLSQGRAVFDTQIM